MKLVNIFHIIFVGGLFLYFGITQTNNPKIALKILMYLGIFIIFIVDSFARVGKYVR